MSKSDRRFTTKAHLIEAAGKCFKAVGLPLFDPLQGEVVLEPEAPGNGYWVGAPSVLWDGAEGCWWLTYRRRRPRGVDPDGRGSRGYVGRVARSTDGLHFEDVWEVVQGTWDTASMERFSIARTADGRYRLYVSYVDPRDDRWRIDLLEAEHPERFDARALRPVFTAGTVASAAGEAVEGVKDPYVFRAGDTWYMLISYAAATARTDEERGRMHATADIFNTGLTSAPTALATSSNGLDWTWQGRILDVGQPGSWDGYQSRLNSVVPLAGVWLGFYDGSVSERENYEERCGLAVSLDLRTWPKLTPTGPAIVTPHGTGSVRYVESVRRNDDLHCYYELARPDGAHELRRAVVPLGVA
jgi:hypothetical protein